MYIIINLFWYKPAQKNSITLKKISETAL